MTQHRLLGWLTALATALCASASAAETARLTAGIKDEVAVEGYNNEPIIAYAPTSKFARLGQPVGQLLIVTDAGPAPCTAFLVSDRHILTNHHCIPGVLDQAALGATKITSVTLALGFLNPGRQEEAQFFPVNPVPIETNEALDYSVLEVDGSPGTQFGTLPLATTPVTEGMPFLIIGHPLGKSQHISREGCRSARPAIEGDRLRHTCDTLGGNSGSPIIDASTGMVVGLHNSGDSAAGVNFGIPMDRILAASKVLRPAPPPGTGVGPDSAMLIYPEALTVGALLTVKADVPAACAPAFVNIAPGGTVTPVPLQYFEAIPLSSGQTRYQITAVSRFKLIVQEADAPGVHRFGVLCPPAGTTAEALPGLLRAAVSALNTGAMSGKVEGSLYHFADWTRLP